MPCRYSIAEVALEWWRASGAKTPERLASLVDHYLETNAISDDWERKAIHADALANRQPWEV